jgi:membrane-associated protease RseP (regulator of RpoE activity)
MSDPQPPISYSFEVPAYPQVFAPSARQRRPYWLHILLLLLTIATTLVVGARLQYNFTHALPAITLDSFSDLFPVMWISEKPARLAMGIPFSATLLGILLAHEFGHYILCEMNGVYATLPYFIPAPLISPIGTFGAVIRIKSHIRSRQALFDIGIAGPIGGFLVAVPVLLWGLALSKPMPTNIPRSALDFGYPLIFRIGQYLLTPFSPHAASLGNLYLHPVAVAAWVGMFATALNLLPGGQFDGGHILYAVAPRFHKWGTRLTILGLLPIGYLYWDGWLLWAIILAFTGWRHPRVPPWPDLDVGRRQFAVAALFILALTFALAPIRGASLREILRRTPSETVPTKSATP